jgi:hypothetical protein
MAPWVSFYAFVGASSKSLLAAGASLSDVARSVAVAARVPDYLTSTELGLVVLCTALLLLRPASPAEPLLER